MLTKVNLKTARKFALTSLMAGLVPFISSSPGMGKTATARSIAKENNLKLITIHLSQEDPTCLNGLFNFSEGRTTVLPTKRFPIAGLDNVPLLPQFNHLQEAYDTLLKQNDPSLKQFQKDHCYKGWLVFFDEINAVPKSIQAAAYRILLDKEIGDYNLHPNTFLMCAGNLMTDNATTCDLGTAARSRVIHIHVETDSALFSEVASKLKFDARTQAFLAYQPNQVNNFKQYQLNSADETFCCERTWEFISKLSKQIEPDVTKPIPFEYSVLLQGTIGSVAHEYVQFTQALEGMVKYKDIVANPSSVPVPDKPAVLFLLSNMLIGSVKEKDMTKVVEFMSRLPKEFQMIFVRNCNNNYAWAIDNTKFGDMFDMITETIYG